MERLYFYLPRGFAPTNEEVWYWKLLGMLPNEKVNSNPATNAAVSNNVLSSDSLFNSGTKVATLSVKT